MPESLEEEEGGALDPPLDRLMVVMPINIAFHQQEDETTSFPCILEGRRKLAPSFLFSVLSGVESTLHEV